MLLQLRLIKFKSYLTIIKSMTHDSKESGSSCGKTLKLKMTNNIYLVAILNELIQLTMTLIYKLAANSDNVYDLEWK